MERIPVLHHLQLSAALKLKLKLQMEKATVVVYIKSDIFKPVESEPRQQTSMVKAHWCL